jgi:hypothetical protein
MKLFTLLCLLTLTACVLAATGVSQEVKTDRIEYDMKYLEKDWGIKLRTAAYHQGKTEGDMLLTMTLEFTKDIKDYPGVLYPAQRRNLRRQKVLPNLRDLFAGKPEFTQTLLRCYFFDADGVAFTKQPPGKIEGAVSGKEGDAFRITQSVPSAVFAKTRKVSFREEPAPAQK